jgi:hypothetical protein
MWGFNRGGHGGSDRRVSRVVGMGEWGIIKCSEVQVMQVM